MNCTTARPMLLALSEGTLPEALRPDLDQHLASCPECALRHRRLSALAAPASELPDSVPPGRDLWPAIRTRLMQPAAEEAPPRVSLAHAAAFVLALGLAAVLATTGALRHLRPAPEPEAAQETTIDPADALAASFLPTRNALLKLAAGNGDDLALGPSLRAAEAAIGHVHAALRHEPDDPKLLLQLARAYREEMKLLRRAAESGGDAPPDSDTPQPSTPDPAS